MFFSLLTKWFVGRIWPAGLSLETPDLEGYCLYLHRREFIYKATVCTSSVGIPLESNCLYQERRGGFRQQLFAPPLSGLIYKETVCTACVGVDLESNSLCTARTSSVGMVFESNRLYLQRRDAFRKQLFIPGAQGWLQLATVCTSSVRVNL